MIVVEGTSEVPLCPQWACTICAIGFENKIPAGCERMADVVCFTDCMKFRIGQQLPKLGDKSLGEVNKPFVDTRGFKMRSSESSGADSSKVELRRGAIDGQVSAGLDPALPLGVKRALEGAETADLVALDAFFTLAGTGYSLGGSQLEKLAKCRGETVQYLLHRNPDREGNSQVFLKTTSREVFVYKESELSGMTDTELAQLVQKQGRRRQEAALDARHAVIVDLLKSVRDGTDIAEVMSINFLISEKEL